MNSISIQLFDSLLPLSWLLQDITGKCMGRVALRDATCNQLDNHDERVLKLQIGEGGVVRERECPWILCICFCTIFRGYIMMTDVGVSETCSMYSTGKCIERSFYFF